MTTSSIIENQTFLPPDAGSMAEVYDFVQARARKSGSAGEPRYFLSGPGPDDQVELPREMYEVLRYAIDAMHEGLAVHIAPVSKTLTTQQSADLLGISRPTIIRLLETGQIPFERVGTHRRVLLAEVVQYRNRRREEQYAALDAIAADSDAEIDIEEELRALRAARKEVGQRRRAHRV